MVHLFCRHTRLGTQLLLAQVDPAAPPKEILHHPPKEVLQHQLF
jgi:hypothetical protein